MGIEWYVLIGMGRFPIDVKGQGAGGIAQNSDVEHCYFAVGLHFFRPLDIWMDVVDVCEEWIYVCALNPIKYPELTTVWF